MKTRLDNDMIDRIDLVKIKTETKLLGHIWLGVVCDENQTKQQLDWSSKCVLRRKWYWTIMTNKNECILLKKPNKTMTSSIIQVWSM